MYEMEGPRLVLPPAGNPVTQAARVWRDMCPADLADRSPGRRLRRDTRRITIVSQLPGLR
jgi:hypothetical protein